MKIYKQMAAILADFPVVTKDQRNTGGGNYNYRGIDDALGALHPLLAKHGVFLALANLEPEYHPAGKTKAGADVVRCVLTGQVRFFADDGSFVEVALCGEGIDTADKALMKSQANGLKYVIWYTFVVPTLEKKDSEAFDDPDIAEPAKAPARTRKATSTATRNPVVAELEACKDAKGFQALLDRARVERTRLPSDSPDRDAITAAVKAKAAEFGIELNPQRATAAG